MRVWKCQQAMSALFVVFFLVCSNGVLLAQPSPESKKAAQDFKAAIGAGNTKGALEMLKKQKELLQPVQWDVCSAVLEKVKPGTCYDDLLIEIQKQGLKCKSLETLANAGCQKALKALMANATDDDVLEISFSSKLEGGENAELTGDAIAAGVLLVERRASLCEKDGGGERTRSCAKLAGARDSMAALIFRVLSKAKREEYIKVAKAHGSNLEQFACLVAKRISEEVNRFEACTLAEERLVRLSLNKPLSGCPLAPGLTKLVSYHCIDGLTLLAPYVPGEDLALATLTFNKNGQLELGTITDKGLAAIQQLADLLTDLNGKACEREPVSDACKAGDHVKEQMERIVAAKVRKESPESIAKDACEIFRAMDFDRKVIEENKDAVDWIHLYYLQRSQRALATWEARLEQLKIKYKKASGNDFDTGTCK